MNKNVKLIYFVTEDWYFWSHRKDLALQLAENGFDVTVATRSERALQEKIVKSGLGLQLMPFRRSMKNPLMDLYASVKMVWIIHRKKPSIVHLVALKPILVSVPSIYLFKHTRFVHALAGLGYVFTSDTKKASIFRTIALRLLVKIFNRENSSVLVQNEDDKILVDKEILTGSSKGAVVVAGSGIDIEKFSPPQNPSVSKIVLVILPARVLVEKGCIEFLAAAKLIDRERFNCKFAIVGGVDSENPGQIGEQEIRSLSHSSKVEWWGHREDMVSVYQQADIVCLPSYREGLPKSLLEAAACGKPLISTKVAGCKEICIDGQTGLSVQPRSVVELKNALEKLLSNKALREGYGRNARKLVEERFSLEVITRETQQFYEQLGSNREAIKE